MPADRIEATVANGWLTLKGEVKHQSQSDAVLDAVCRLPGIGGIMNKDRRHHRRYRRLVDWQTPEVVDAAVSGLCGTVVRRSAVEAEIAAAESAERKAK